MANTLNCENYTYILSNPDVCLDYAKEHKEQVCGDTTLKYSFKTLCSPQNASNTQDTTSTASTSFNDISARLVDSLDQESQISIGILLLLLVGFIIGYFTYVFIRPSIDKKKKLHFLRVKFPNPDLDKEYKYQEAMESFFSSIHKLLKDRRLSFEIHKVAKRIELIITYNDLRIGENIKGYLTSIEGINIEELSNEEDPLAQYSPIMSYKLILTKNYYSLNLNQKNFYRQVIDYLASLEDQDQAGVVFVIRPTDKKVKIDQELNKRDKKLDENKESLEVYKNEKDSLLEKQSSNLFLCSIYTIGNSSRSREGISSLFNSLDNKNNFTFKNGLTRKDLSTRYTPFENFFTDYFRKSFGSFLNAKELALLIHPSKLERGKYKAQETVVLEAEPEFLEENSNNILIGKSVLKTGKPVNIYLPIDNLQRHLYLAGSTGMGKSTVMIKLFLSLCEKKPETSLVLFDPHGEDLLEIAYRIPDWSNIIYFNLAESSKTFTFNPLFTFKKSVKDKDNKVEQIMKILSEEAEKKNKDLGTSIEKLLKFLVQTSVHFPDAYYQYLLSCGHTEEEAETIVFDRQITFADLPFVLQSNSGYEDVMTQVFAEYKEDIALKWTKNLDNYMTNKAILDGVDNRLSFVVQDSLVDLFEGRSFDINKAIAEHKRILMPISEQSFGRISKKLVTKFFLNEIWAEAQSITLKEERNEVILFIDEFQEAQLDIIDDLLAQARKYKIRLIFGNQFLGQLWDNIRKSVLGNVSTLFSFKVQNLEEAETITPMFKNKISSEDIVSLPKFSAYLRTLNTSGNDDVAFMSFKTINYDDEIKAVHSHQELKQLNEECLSKYGEEKEVIKKKRLYKITNPREFFLELKEVV